MIQNSIEKGMWRSVFMIKTELNYNPYLLETSVKFNGQDPRINSLVEKYQEGTLQEWVRILPDIFYDEMNGFDFELEFSGTKRDFLEVMDAFQRKGITNDMVYIFHKNELDSRYEKVKYIDSLFNWLAENTNRNFEFSTFKDNNTYLIHRSFVYIIFQGDHLSTETIDDEDVSVEHVTYVEELCDTELKNTPILFCISQENIQAFQRNLLYFLQRDDVECNQLFFLIHPKLDTAKVERTIKDLGINEPNIIEDVFDEAVKKYLEIYPVSEYIYSVISLLRKVTNEVSENLEVESENFTVANKETYSHIEEYESILSRLKGAHRKFLNRDNIEIPTEWFNMEKALMNSVNTWRKRKTKITDDSEAREMAEEFENDVKKFFHEFIENLVESACNKIQDIRSTYENWYKNIAYDEEFQTNVNAFIVPKVSEEIVIADELKKIYGEEYVQPKEDIFGLIFKSPTEMQGEPILQRIYYYQNWRDYVATVLYTKTKKIVQDVFESIQNYEQRLSDAYISHILDLIEEVSKLKEQEAAKLSDEERLLQEDIDWLVEVQDQLKVIERG